jgi:hypothetical protein
VFWEYWEEVGGWGAGEEGEYLVGDSSAIVWLESLLCAALHRMGWKGFIVRIPRWSLSFGIDCVLGRDVVE